MVDLNAELQTVPERCPLEVSAMCDMVAGNKLQAENYTYLVRGDILRSVLLFGIFFHRSFIILAGRFDKRDQRRVRSGKRRPIESAVDIGRKCQYSQGVIRADGKREME